MPGRTARALLAVFPVAVLVVVGGVRLRVLPAQPASVWALAILPCLALVLGPRTRLLVLVALGELVALVPVHAFVTLVRAARLEGG